MRRKTEFDYNWGNSGNLGSASRCGGRAGGQTRTFGCIFEEEKLNQANGTQKKEIAIEWW